MSKSVLVALANGTEEMEAVICIDVLRRAGADVVVAGTHSEITCSRGVNLICDALVNDIPEDTNYDMIVIPGGIKGVENLIKSEVLKKLCLNNSKNNYICAICAAPIVLQEFGLLHQGIELTSHPSVRSKLEKVVYSEQNVVKSGRIITSRGAGTSFEFSFELVTLLFGKDISDKITSDIVYSNNLI